MPPSRREIFATIAAAFLFGATPAAAQRCRETDLLLNNRPDYDRLTQCVAGLLSRIDDLESVNKLQQQNICYMAQDIFILRERLGISGDWYPPDGCPDPRRRRK